MPADIPPGLEQISSIIPHQRYEDCDVFLRFEQTTWEVHGETGRWKFNVDTKKEAEEAVARLNKSFGGRCLFEYRPFSVKGQAYEASTRLIAKWTKGEGFSIWLTN